MVLRRITVYKFNLDLALIFLTIYLKWNMIKEKRNHRERSVLTK